MGLCPSSDYEAVSAFCWRHHVDRLSQFGSGLLDEFKADGDMDVLVESPFGHVPGLRFVTLERRFSELLHDRRMAIVTPKRLNPRDSERGS